jgi:hypothetical protein
MIPRKGKSGAERVPSLARAIVGSPIRGSWWGHPRAREIFALTRAVRASGEILVCRLVEGKVTFVHRRLWPALTRLSGRFPRKRLARIREVHTPTGRHVIEQTAFPRWVPADVQEEAQSLSEQEAASALGL